jgi:putative endonuclease
MYYVYVLCSTVKNTEFYIGYTSDLRKRVKEHNEEKSFHTKKYAPWKLVYYEAYISEKLAITREKKLKHHGKGFSELKKRIFEDKKVRD